MASRTIFKPGVLQGPYPEKIIRSPGFLDQPLSSAANQITLKVKYNPKSLQAFAKAVDLCGDALVNFDEAALELHIQQVKARLHLRGFEAGPVSEAFALIREISGRKLSMRHFEVQLIGGWVMLQGMIAEMKTGEGKTLTATLPACVAAMAGVPVHIVTVNDYLVTRDAELMGPIYQTLGLTVGTIIEGMDFDARKAAYACDITYCSNKQLTFDYLKDRLVLGRKTSRLQLQLNRLYSERETKASKLLL